MDVSITLTVNGKQRTVTTDPRWPLLDVLREDLKLTGRKYGCGEGQWPGLHGAGQWQAGNLLSRSRRSSEG